MRAHRTPAPGGRRFVVRRPVYETEYREEAYDRISYVNETEMRQEKYLVQRPVDLTADPGAPVAVPAPEGGG